MQPRRWEVVGISWPQLRGLPAAAEGATDLTTVTLPVDQESIELEMETRLLVNINVLEVYFDAQTKKTSPPGVPTQQAHASSDASTSIQPTPEKPAFVHQPQARSVATAVAIPQAQSRHATELIVGLGFGPQTRTPWHQSMKTRAVAAFLMLGAAAIALNHDETPNYETIELVADNQLVAVSIAPSTALTSTTAAPTTPAPTTHPPTTAAPTTAAPTTAAPTTAAPTTTVPATTAQRCDPNYSGCVPIASDVDCAGGSGNGPAYVRGPVQVIGRDIYGLDRDKDGVGCE